MNGDLLKETMRRAAAREPSALDAFARFQKVRRRAGMLRSAVVLGSVGLAAGLLVATLPSTLKSDQRSQLIAPSVTAAQVRFTDPVGRYTLAHPASLDGGGQPGHEAFFSLVRASTALHVQVEPEMRTTLARAVARAVAYHRVLQASGVSVSRAARTTLGGRPAVEYEVAYPGAAPADASLSNAWCLACTSSQWLVDWGDGEVLHVSITYWATAVTPQDLADARATTDSIRPLG